jgi:hypothetical protein
LRLSNLQIRGSSFVRGDDLQLVPKKRNAMGMELRPLGSMQLLVSPIGLGLAALGRPGYINLHHAEDLGSESNEAALEDRAHQVLDTAWDGYRRRDHVSADGTGRACSLLLGNPKEAALELRAQRLAFGMME